MNAPLALAFLFFIGSSIGWIFEFFFRNLISKSGPRNKYFINPGFCKGPYLPIYGVGFCVMFCISYETSTHYQNASIFLTISIIGITMTIIEFIGGIFMLKVMNLRLWDYRNEPLNIMGVICPTFSLIWSALGAFYYLIIHPKALKGLIWLSNNLAFSFFIGLFFGFFVIDMCLSIKETLPIKKFGDENSVIIKIEEFKQHLNQRKLQAQKRFNFFNQLKYDDRNINELLAETEHIKENKFEAFKNRRIK